MIGKIKPGIVTALEEYDKAVRRLKKEIGSKTSSNDPGKAIALAIKQYHSKHGVNLEILSAELWSVLSGFRGVCRSCGLIFATTTEEMRRWRPSECGCGGEIYWRFWPEGSEGEPVTEKHCKRIRELNVEWIMESDINCGPIREGEEYWPFHKPEEGEEYCLFHKPEKNEEEAKEFYTNLEEQGSVKVDEEGKKNLVFKNKLYWEGYVFPVFKSRNFDHAIFEDETYFTDATFEGEAYFGHATFKKQTSFSGAIFEDKVIFTDAIFEDAAWFNNTTFKDKVYFRRATIKFIAGFDYTTFEDEANFSNSNYYCTHFENAVFKASVRFTDTTFEDEIYFGDATFEDDADFTGATFKNWDRFGMDWDKIMRTITGEFNKQEIAEVSVNYDKWKDHHPCWDQNNLPASLDILIKEVQKYKKEDGSWDAKVIFLMLELTDFCRALKDDADKNLKLELNER